MRTARANVSDVPRLSALRSCAAALLVLLAGCVAAPDSSAAQSSTNAAQANGDCSPSAPTVLSASSGGSLTDSSGNTWSLTQSGDIQENGQNVPGGGGSSGLTLIGDSVWGRDAASGGWYQWTNGQWQGPSGDPTAQVTVCPPSQTVGGDGTAKVLHVGDSGSITEDNGNELTITSSGNIQENGQDIPGGAGSSAVAYVNGVIWGEDAKSGGWYQWTGSQWQGPSADPTGGMSGGGSGAGGTTGGGGQQSSGTRSWCDNPGQDGTFWVQPFQTTAKWTTSGPVVDALRNGVYGQPTGFVNVKGNWAVPWVIGRASDPVVTVTDGNKSIQVHVPAGTVTEEPYDVSTDSAIGGCDSTQPYLVWSISGAHIDTGSVGDGSVIHGNYGFSIDDGSGPIMMDAVTGQPGTGNALGGIQDLELSAANADPSYVIQHMLQYILDPSQVNNEVLWPLLVSDQSHNNTGSVPQGATIGIPADMPRPQGKSRGFYLLFDNLQQYGWFYYNVGGAGSIVLRVYSTMPENQALVNDIQNSISDVVQYIAILANQYGIDSQKGYEPGGTDAFPAPPPLDLSPTGGHHVAPHTFGAWYPSGYDVTPSP